MGWGTNYLIDGYLSKMTFRDELEVQDKIDENLKTISDAKQRIKMFVSATPNTIVPSEWNEQPIDWLSNEVETWFEMMEDAFRENVLLYQYIEYLTEGGENNIIVDWEDFVKLYCSETNIAHKAGMSSIEPIPTSKNEVLQLFQKYKI